MARSFIVHVPGFSTLQEREKRKYQKIVDSMNEQYSLPRGISDSLAKELGCTTANVLQIARIIHVLSKLYKGDERAIKEVHDRIARNDFEALKIHSLWEKSLSWPDLEGFMDDEKLADILNFNKTLTEMEKSLEEEIFLLQARVNELEKENMHLQKTVNFLKQKLGEEDTCEEFLSDDQFHKKSIFTRHEIFVRNHHLPDMGRAFNREDAPIRYTAKFQKKFSGLGENRTNKNGPIVQAILQLAKKGRRDTPHLHHKPFKRNMTFAPTNCTISSVGKVRIVWDYDSSNKQIVFYYIGNHDEVWDSES